MNQAELDRGVLGRAFTLLEAMVGHSEGVGLTWIAHFCGIPKATAHRLLRQLEALGVVDRSDGLYRVGSQVFRLGQAWEPYPGLLTAARRPLHELTVTTRTSAVLTVPHPGEALIAAASPAQAEDVPLLRPGRTLAHDLGVVSAPVLAPTGRNVGAVAAVLPGHRQRDSFDGAVRHAARAIEAALRR